MKSNTLAVLPQPFAWMPISAGKVTVTKEWREYSESQIFDVSAFDMAKYPCTNAQFKLFMDAGGYAEKRWWTDDGWADRQVFNWLKPRLWDDSQFNSAEQPVVGVSWYEAVAFCNWLSEMTDENIMLPTEQQWQHAAQGDDGLVYPWGNDWDGSRCNNNVDGQGIGKTTPVRQYEGKGDSPFGVVDMAGNVFEWCKTGYETDVQDLQGRDARVKRGGSWHGIHVKVFRAVGRFGDSPHYRNAPLHSGHITGFRIARLPK